MSDHKPFSLPGLTRFDRLVLLIALALLVAILLTVLLGDHVGVQLVRTAPVGAAHSTHWITIQFSETMDRASVAERLRLEPSVAGDLSWNGATLIFRPEAALVPGESYAVVLASGAVGQTGRPVLAEHHFTFTVQPPLIAYLAPANDSPQNIWLADPAEPVSARQITFSEGGIFNFAISPDGDRLAYAEYSPDTGSTNLWLMDLAGGAAEPLTNCPDADCTTPVWRPDGGAIAYERMSFSSDFNLGTTPTRVWLLDLSTDPPTDRPLFSDPQMIAYAPLWSPDGSRIAVYDNRGAGILIYDPATEDVMLIPSRHGTTGTFSPDGSRLVYPNVVIGQEGARTHLGIANLETAQLSLLNESTDPVDDEQAVWSPDGETLIVRRRYLDERYTPGRQLYRVDVTTGDAKPLLVDEAYYHGFIALDPSGRQLLVQRFRQEDAPLGGPGSEPIVPEIWVYDLASEALTLVVSNAFLPQWAP